MDELLDLCKLLPDEHKGRDALILCQQGPTIITHIETKRRFDAFRFARAPKPGVDKKVERVQKELEKIRSKTTKKAETDRKRREEEKVRFQGITMEQKKEETLAKLIAAK